MIKISVNNKHHHFSSEISLLDMLQEMHMADPKGMAIAVNNEVIPKDTWSKHSLKDEDKVLIIKASQGG